MRESDIFQYISRKYEDQKEVWLRVERLAKFDSHGRVISVHEFDMDCFVSSFGRLMRDGTICDLTYCDKWDISSMFTDVMGAQVRFKRHQIVMQTFYPDKRQQYDTVDHIENTQRYDNSIYNLRWANKDTQCTNRHNKPGKSRMVVCIGDSEEIYFSCREVERIYDLPCGSVGRVCRGEIDTINGYRFCYL